MENIKQKDRRQTDLKDRFYRFALEVVKLVRTLPKETAGFQLGSQLIKAGTSVAANYEEATGAFSKPDFVFKVSIAFKEAKESRIWLRLIRDSGLCRKTPEIEMLIQEALEIASILAKSLKTARVNSEQKK